PTFKGVVKILPMRGSAVDESGARCAECPSVADGRTGTFVIASSERALDVVFPPRGHAEADNVDKEILAFFAQCGWQHLRTKRNDRVGQFLGDRRRGQVCAHNCTAITGGMKAGVPHRTSNCWRVRLRRM